MFKNIEKQDTERTLGDGANGKMTIGKSDFKKGITTYAQKWKRAETYKRKSEGGFQAKNEIHDYSTTPTQGEYWSGLNPTILSKNNNGTGATTNMLRKEYRKNDTYVMKSKDQKHIGLLMKKNSNCQLSFHHLESI